MKTQTAAASSRRATFSKRAPALHAAAQESQLPLAQQLVNAQNLGHRLAPQASRNTRISPPLQVRPPGDFYEAQADRVAENVVNELNGERGGYEPITPLSSSPATAPVQRNAEPSNNHGELLTPELSSQIHLATAGGAPVPGSLRESAESVMNHRLADVRIHHDSQADSLAKELRANAFTVGRDVFFRAGKYAPGDATGQRLLAHEVAHTAQQHGQDSGTDVAYVQRNGDGDNHSDQGKKKKRRMPADGAGLRIISGQPTQPPPPPPRENSPPRMAAEAAGLRLRSQPIPHIREPHRRLRSALRQAEQRSIDEQSRGGRRRKGRRGVDTVDRSENDPLRAALEAAEASSAIESTGGNASIETDRSAPPPVSSGSHTVAPPLSVEPTTADSEDSESGISSASHSTHASAANDVRDAEETASPSAPATQRALNPRALAFRKQHEERRRRNESSVSSAQFAGLVAGSATGPIAAEAPGSAISTERLRKGARLGSGSFGTVHSLVDGEGDSDLVVKTPSAKGQADLQHEAGILEELVRSGVDRSNIVTSHGMHDIEGKEGLVMEKLGGGTLNDAMARIRQAHQDGEITDDEFWAANQHMFQGVLQGLDALSQARIVHGDIQPTNVMLTNQGVPKLMDFGTARKEGNDRHREQTPDYQTPERLTGKPGGETATHKDDLWSFAQMMFAQQNQGNAFRNGARRGDNNIQNFFQLMRSFENYGSTDQLGINMPEQDGLEKQFKQLLQLMMAPNRDDRPGSAAGVLQEHFFQRDISDIDLEKLKRIMTTATD